MIKPIEQITPLTKGGHFYLQSLYNDTNEAGEPVAGNSYYVGYPCADVDEPTPLPDNQPGQVYLTDGIASLAHATDDIQP